MESTSSTTIDMPVEGIDYIKLSGPGVIQSYGGITLRQAMRELQMGQPFDYYDNLADCRNQQQHDEIAMSYQRYFGFGIIEASYHVLRLVKTRVSILREMREIEVHLCLSIHQLKQIAQIEKRKCPELKTLSDEISNQRQRLAQLQSQLPDLTPVEPLIELLPEK